MNEEHYREARDSVSQPRCVYELALQHGQLVCQNKSVMLMGEREALYCTANSARVDCQRFYTLCVSHSGFALGDAQLPKHLPFNKTVKVQIGGLQGVRALLEAEKDAPAEQSASELPDVAELISGIKASAGQFDRINFSRIMPFITRFNMRKKKPRNTSG